MFLAVGICGRLGQICLLGALRTCATAVVAPFQYTQMLRGIFYGRLFWGDRPGRRTLGGAAIVIASGLYILYRETVRHPELNTAVKNPLGSGAPLLLDPEPAPSPTAEPGERPL